MQVNRHRLCCMPFSRIHLSIKEASKVRMWIPPSNKVIKTRYSIVKKTPSSPFGTPSLLSSLPSWQTRRISLSRFLVLNHLRSAITGEGKPHLVPPDGATKATAALEGFCTRCLPTRSPKLPAGLVTATGPFSTQDAWTLPPPEVVPWPAGPSSGAWLSSGRRGRRKRRRESTACITTALAGVTVVNAAPISMTPRRWPCTPDLSEARARRQMGPALSLTMCPRKRCLVCSYFLKGICSNSNCPYSHLYVSCKTEVCSDFLKAYCLLGAKCKKQHTLLCPDFALRGICLRGSQCQLLHRNQKRHGRWTAATPIPGPSDGAPRSKASAGYVLRKPTTTQRPARQMSSSGLTSRTEAPAFPPPSSRVLASTSTLSSKATAASSPSFPSPSSPIPSLDQEKLSLGQVGQAQEQAPAASASCHPSAPCIPVQAQEA